VLTRSGDEGIRAGFRRSTAPAVQSSTGGGFCAGGGSAGLQGG
jgi:hypothetical protein